MRHPLLQYEADIKKLNGAGAWILKMESEFTVHQVITAVHNTIATKSNELNMQKYLEYNKLLLRLHSGCKDLPVLAALMEHRVRYEYSKELDA